MAIERKKTGVYKARYTKNGKKITVGTFQTRTQAEIALAKARNTTVFASTPKSDNTFSNFAGGGYADIKKPLIKRVIQWLKNLRAN